MRIDTTARQAGITGALLLSVAAATWGSGCTSSTGTADAPNTSGGSLPCDVEHVLVQKCGSCHGAQPAFGAPMPLATYADLMAPALSDPSRRVADVVADRIHSDAHRMPPSPTSPLDDSQTATLDAWLHAGTPGSDATCPPETAPTGTSGPLSCTPDVKMSPASPWSMPETKDDVYVCYGFDVTAAQKRHLIGIAPRIDNGAIVHHLVLFQSPNAVSSTPTPCSTEATMSWRVVYAWGPGAGNFEFPPDAGYPEEGTTHYVAQVHYNNVRHLASQTDASGFDVCTTDQLRANDADVFVFGAPAFTIPARSPLDITCSYKVPKELADKHLFAAWPHMHQLGQLLSVVQLPGGSGDAVDLGKRAPWNFESQSYVPIDATLGAGDVVKTRCAWNNPTDKPVSFGLNTEDEMCLSFTMYYPRVEASSFGWTTPTDDANCAPTPP